MQKLYRMAGAGVGAVTLAAGLILTSAQAGVAAQPKVQTASPRTTNHHLKETFGSFKVGAPTLGQNLAVDETENGRALAFLPDGGTDGGIELQINGTGLCVAAAADRIHVVQHLCNGGLGTVWFEEACPSSTLFENRANRGCYLTGPNNAGQFEIMTRPAPSGFEQQFTVTTP